MLYEYVVAQGREVSRGEAAEAVGVQRTLAAFHLDRLVEAGLLEVGRAGSPAAPGRAAAARRRSTAGPPPSTRCACRPGTTGRRRCCSPTWSRRWRRTGGAEDAARRAVGTIGEAEPRDADLAAVLAARGYQPYTDERGALRLRNRPFHLPAERQPTLVCAR